MTDGSMVRSVMVRAAVAVMLAGLFLSPCPVRQARADAPVDLAPLVQQLGNPQYGLRQDAEDRLRAVGTGAREALMKGLEDEDPQVRRSCRRVLAEVMAAAFQQRLLGSEPGELPGIEVLRSVPGWERFAARVGVDGPSRQLFVQMYQAEPALFAALEDGPKAAADAIYTRYFQVHSRTYSRMTAQRKPPSIGTIAAMVFVCSDPRLEIPRELLDHYSWYSLLQQNGMRQALTAGAQQEAARAILGLWIAMPGGSNVAYNKLRMGIRYPVPEALDLALVVLEQEDITNGNLYGFSMQTIGILGGSPYAGRISRMLESEIVVSRRTVVQNNERVTIEIQLRDVALAWLIFLTGQDHTGYGMLQARNTFQRIRQSPTSTVSVSLMGYDKPERRTEAMAKWHQYVAEHPLPDPPGEIALLSPASIKRGPGQAALDEVIKRIKAAVPRSINPPAATAEPQKPGDEGQAARPAGKRPRPRILPGGANNIKPLFGQGTPPPLTIPGLPVADRDMTRRLILARKAIRQDDLADAVLILGAMLAEQQDFTFREDRLVPVSQGLKAAVERLIGELPERGRELYESHFGAEAQKQLDEALTTGQREQLLAVSGRFFHTRAGAEATYLAGVRLLEENRPLQAAMLLERLVARSRHTGMLEPDLSLQLVIGWARAGMPGRVRKVLADLQRMVPALEMTVDGARQRLFVAGKDPLAQLARVTGPVVSSLDPDDWPVYRGNWQRNQISTGGGPYFSDTPLLEVSSSELIRQQTRQLEEKYRSEFQSVLPSLQPLVVGDRILVRTATHLVAISALDGEMLWQAEFFDDLYRLASRPAEEWDAPDLEMMRRGLELRLWNNPTYGTISSDGEQVYGVEGLGFSEVALSQQLVVAEDGSRRLDAGMLKTHNQLAAYNLVTGKLQWEVGGALGSGASMEGVFFLGPPLPLGERLFVIGRTQQYVALMELDAASGKMLWEKILVVQEAQPANFQQPGIPPVWGTLSETWRCGGSPSYSQGVLVCPLSDRRVAAIDLTSRSILWIYQPESSEGIHASRMAQLRLMTVQNSVHGLSNTWADNSVTISNGRVLLTPADAERLYCLDLFTGQVSWTQSRNDGWYVAGVDSGILYLVGHRGVRALRLADGSPVWERPHSPFPPGSTPSGRGYLAEERLFVPLSIGEVVAFDTVDGRLASRSRSGDTRAPGNLVRCHDQILSQTACGLWKYQPLEKRRQGIMEKLSKRPDDIDLLIDRGELLLYSGEIQAAVEGFLEVLEREDNSRASYLLSLALVDGLHADFEASRDQIQQLLPKLKTSSSDATFLKELVQVYQKGGDSLRAMESCLLLAGREDELTSMEFVDSVRQVRRDRWIQARLLEIWEAADEDVRGQMQKLLENHVAQHGGAGSLLAGLPMATRFWLAEATAAAEKNQFSDAEFLLRHVMVRGNPVEKREATARLAVVYQSSKQFARAGVVYQLLETQYADLPCLAGKTGRQLSQARPPNAPSREVAEQIPSASHWKNRSPHLRETRGTRGISYRYPVRLDEHQASFLQPLRLEIDSQARIVSAIGPLGHPRWELNTMTDNVSVPYRGPSYHRMQGSRQGSMVVIWTGDRVFALDTTEAGATVKWEKKTWKDATSWQMQFGVNQFGIQILKNMAQPLPAAERIPLHVTADVTCYQQGSDLVALSTRSGEIIWLRRDLPLGCDLYGDEELLFVTPPDSRDCQVLQLHDGKELGQRQVLPVNQRMAVRGRLVLTWQSDKQGSGWQLRDTWEEEEIWSRQFPAGTLPWLVNSHELAAVGTDGTMTVLEFESGKQLLQARVELPEDLVGAAVFHDQGRYLVTTEKEDERPNLMNNPTLATAVQVHGIVTSLDDRTGEVAWSREVLSQALRMDRVRHLPLLVFMHQVRMVDEKGRSTYQGFLLGLDKQSGETILDQKRQYGDVVYSITARPEKQLVELLFRSGTIRLYYTKEAPPVDAQEKEPMPGKPTEPGNVPARPKPTPLTPADQIRNLFRRLERDISRQLR
ncbi:MAG: PQQ-binding-like beta-propeller repeat protein [Planctomycetota bacterium]|nr:PQQ-binding-like beta-propeller repeat protein [Planctomycetota bacterium]